MKEIENEARNLAQILNNPEALLLLAIEIS